MTCQRTTIKDVYDTYQELAGHHITVSGWVRSARDMKQFGFITINDGSCFDDLQLVLNRADSPSYDDVLAVGGGAAVVASGELVLTPDRAQSFEVKVQSLDVVADSGTTYPIQKKRATREFLRTIQHLRPRTNLFRAVFKIRSVAAYAIHTFFQKRQFVYVTTPIITTSDAEGAGEMFSVTTLDMKDVPLTSQGDVDWSRDFFNQSASLTVSGQLQAEAFALSFGNVYTFGPTFRAEDSNTRRHAAEFWMVEPEMAFCDLSGVMDTAEAMLKFVISRVLSECSSEMAMLNAYVDKGLIERLNHVVSSDFVRVSYTKAIELLQEAASSGKATFEYPVSWGIDLQTEHERYLSEQHFKRPVFVYDYPQKIKAFYMRVNDETHEGEKTVAACDCLVPSIGEIIGGSQREERLEVLERRMDELGLNKQAYRYYLDLRRYGGCEHGGFGLGFERLIMYLCGVDNIRDVIPFPRTVGSAEF